MLCLDALASEQLALTENAMALVEALDRQANSLRDISDDRAESMEQALDVMQAHGLAREEGRKADRNFHAAIFDAAGNRPVHGVAFKDTQTEVDIDAGSSIDIMVVDKTGCGRFL